MKIGEYPEVVHNAWAMHESYRRLGFTPDNIFFEICADAMAFPARGFKPLVFSAIVRAQGKEFRVNVGLLGDLGPEKLQTLWTQFSQELTSFDEDEMGRVYEAAMGRLGGRVGLLLAMMEKGFHFPRGAN